MDVEYKYIKSIYEGCLGELDFRGMCGRLSDIVISCLKNVCACDMSRYVECGVVLNNILNNSRERRLFERDVSEFGLCGMYVNDDVGEFINWMCDTGRLNEMSDDMMMGMLDGLLKINVSGARLAEIRSPFLRCLVFGSYKIFNYICGIVDLGDYVKYVENASWKIVVCKLSLVGGDMRIIRRLGECGFDYGDSSIMCEWMCGCKDELLYWLMCKLNNNINNNKITYKQLCCLVNSCRYSVIHRYGLVCDERSDGSRVRRSLTGIHEMMNATGFKYNKLYNIYKPHMRECADMREYEFVCELGKVCSISMKHMVMHVGDFGYAVRCDDGRCADEMRMVEYCIARGYVGWLNVMNVDMGKLTENAKCMLLISDSDRLFEMGVMDDSVVVGCYNELYYSIAKCVMCVGEMSDKYYGRIVRMLSRVGELCGEAVLKRMLVDVCCVFGRYSICDRLFDRLGELFKVDVLVGRSIQDKVRMWNEYRSVNKVLF